MLRGCVRIKPVIPGSQTISASYRDPESSTAAESTFRLAIKLTHKSLIGAGCRKVVKGVYKPLMQL